MKISLSRLKDDVDVDMWGNPGTPYNGTKLRVSWLRKSICIIAISLRLAVKCHFQLASNALKYAQICLT
jgi:hypothetical protein